MKMLTCVLSISFWIIARVTAVDSTKTHYGLKGGRVCLHVGNLSGYEVKWSFNGKRIVDNGKTTAIAPGKVYYDSSTFSLCIKNLTDADSNTYTMSAYQPVTFEDLSQSHELIIEESVPVPVIRTSVLDANQSVGFCDISVNCSVQNDLVSAVCNANGCRASPKSDSKFNISVGTFNNSIVCTGKNHVSVSNDSVGFESACVNTLKPKSPEESPRESLSIILLVVIMIVLGFTVFMAKKLCQSKSNLAETPNSHLTASQAVAQVPQRPPQISAPPSVVSLRVEMESEPNDKVDSVYSFLQLPVKANSQDVKGQRTVPVAPSHSVAVSEAEQLPHVDTQTLYSVLKPKKAQPQHHQQDKT